MLGNFIYSNPTKLYFGDEAQKNLVDALSGFGKKVMLTYGGGSIKRNGIYDDVIAALSAAGKEVVELSGVMPNPTVDKLIEGCKVARENDVDFILAVGGGSTIDYAKAVSVSAWYDGDAWERFWVNQDDPKPGERIIPVGAVLTMAGTGSEMNGGSVITNHATKMKIGKVFGEEVMPKFAVLNPRYTFSLPHRQMVAGIFDTMSHIMEQYFSGDDDSPSDYLAEGLMRSVIASSRVAVKDPENYEARSNLMWSATWALNTLIGEGKSQDWMVHMIGQAIGAYTDATHGMTLSGVSEAYYRHIMKYALKRFARFAHVVWEIPTEGKSDEQLASEGIDALAAWIKEIGAASEITSLGVTEDMLDGIADATIILTGGYETLNHDEIVEILRKSL
ncbi:MAG: iron-containing alcohol dehydrogenase [Bacteroidales bacterium]|nr:iron-containing alcohol dehydrogenase [Bacteroidales bacterium]MBD5342933.1 iron-containing alcohol dehydrogenase [Bacteroides sp.]